MSVNGYQQSPASLFNIQVGDDLTWNVQPLLHEIKHALAELIDSGKTHIIDLRSIPLAPGEEEKIISALGVGEVQAQLNAIGPSEIIETQYAGVWLVTHKNDENEIVSRFIEITRLPDILSSQTEDIEDAYTLLSANLSER
jgi:hydrogenase-1 operon protein HyaF